MFAVVMSLFIILSACGQLEGNSLSFRTADPHLSVGFRLLPAPVPLPTITPAIVPPTAVPTEEPLLPTVTPTPCLIKVNKASNGEFIYHMPDSAAYSQTIIEPARGEFYACSEADAQAHGARKALR